MATTDNACAPKPPGTLFRLIPFVVAALIFLGLPHVLPAYARSLVTKVLIFAIFAMSLDILMGYTGLISFGHAAYFGLGAYTAGVLVLHYNTNNFWISLSLGIVIAVVVAAIFGLIALRVTGFYFIFVTFALGQLLFSVAWKWKWLASMGTEGIFGIPLPKIGLPGFAWSPISFYYFVFVIFVLCFLLLVRLVNSPFGYALMGIRESEPRMRVLGYNTWLYKYLAFVISGAFAGIAGVLFAYHNGSAVPDNFGVVTSTLVLFMVIIGSAGTLYGSLLGAAIIIPVEFYSGIFTPERWPLILGGAYVLAIVYAREGIGIHLVRVWRKVGSRYGSTKG